MSRGSAVTLVVMLAVVVPLAVATALGVEGAVFVASMVLWAAIGVGFLVRILRARRGERPLEPGIDAVNAYESLYFGWPERRATAYGPEPIVVAEALAPEPTPLPGRDPRMR